MKTFLKYWNCYGGWYALFTSIYFLTSVLFTMIIFFITIIDKTTFGTEYWANLSITITPPLLGFALGGFAVFLGIGDQRFIDPLRGKDIKTQKESPFMTVVASFTHFVFFQVLNLINAIFGKIIHTFNSLYCFFSILLFTYSILLSIAALFAIFKLAEWYDMMPKYNKSIEE